MYITRYIIIRLYNYETYTSRLYCFSFGNLKGKILNLIATFIFIKANFIYNKSVHLHEFLHMYIPVYPLPNTTENKT